MKTVFIGFFCVLAACARAAEFPTEDQMKARLRPDMTVEEVISAFGQPSTGVGSQSGPSKLRYIAPFGSMTAKKEGYVGFEVQLVDGKVRGWRTIIGNPSYTPMTVPPEIKWYGRLWVIVLVGALILGVIRTFKRVISEDELILHAYKARDIPTRQLPVEFRFITNDTTLQEIVDKIGPCSRVRKLPVDQGFASGYGLSPGPMGMPSIVLVEYDLPYHAAVILLPEYPFEPENRIRAVFYRRPRPDEEV